MATDNMAKKGGFRLFEKGPGFRSGARDLLKYTNGATLSSAIISTIFGCTGPCLVTIAAAQSAGFTNEETVSWIFGIYVFGGLLGMILALYYKLPISGAFSIPGATLMGTALAGYSFQEAAGAFVLAGIIVLLLGVTGLIGKVMRWLPLPIVMGMIGGCMLKFGTQIITGVNGLPVVCGLAVLAFLLVPRVIKGFPGVLAALIVGVIAAIATNSFAGEAGELAYIPPQLVIPKFNPNLVLSCSLPPSPMARAIATTTKVQAAAPPNLIHLAGISGFLGVGSGMGALLSSASTNSVRPIGSSDHDQGSPSIVRPYRAAYSARSAL